MKEIGWSHGTGSATSLGGSIGQGWVLAHGPGQDPERAVMEGFAQLMIGHPALMTEDLEGPGRPVKEEANDLLAPRDPDG